MLSVCPTYQHYIICLPHLSALYYLSAPPVTNILSVWPTYQHYIIWLPHLSALYEVMWWWLYHIGRHDSTQIMETHHRWIPILRCSIGQPFYAKYQPCAGVLSSSCRQCSVITVFAAWLSPYSKATLPFMRMLFLPHNTHTIKLHVCQHIYNNNHGSWKTCLSF